MHAHTILLIPVELSGNRPCRVNCSVSAGHLPEGNATSNQSGQQEAEVAEVLSTLEQEDRSVTANELTENQDQESWQDIAARNSEVSLSRILQYTF